jgi:hypothetical protein
MTAAKGKIGEEVPVGGSESPPTLTPEDLEKYGLTSSTDLQDEAFARIMLLGASSTGKTTTCLTTSPGPVLVINCDGRGAPQPAVREMPAGRQFFVIDATTRNSWKKACETAVTLAAAGKVRTIVVDTFTLMADNIVDEASRTLDGFDLWREVAKWLQQGIRRLKMADAHLIVVCHMDPNDDEVAGITPLVPGKTKAWLPANLSDKVLFEYDHDTGKRQFLVGPQKYWSHSGRKVKRSCTIPPNVTDLFVELGIAP